MKSQCRTTRTCCGIDWQNFACRYDLRSIKMAYICNRKTPCSQCEHYKFDKEENQMACFAPKEMEIENGKS